MKPQADSTGDTLGQSVSNLWAWLHTWEDGTGGVHGPVVYHHRDNLKVLRPDTWTQGATLLGLLNTYASSGEDSFLVAARRLGGFLASNYLKELHVYRDSNFDQKPLGQPALEGNAIGSLALIELAKALGQKGQEFRSIAMDNITGFVIKQWDPEAAAFSVKYHDGRAHIHNKGAMACLAILAAEGYDPDGEMTQKFAIPSGEFTLKSQVRDGELAGAIPYADRDSNYRTLYSLVTGLGLLGLHKVTRDTRYTECVERLVSHLSGFLDTKTGLICHRHGVGYPQWITDTILFLLVKRTLDQRRGIPEDGIAGQMLQRALSYQYPSGAFPLSLGFEDLFYTEVMKSLPGISRWRDVLPTPGVNSWDFWFLSLLLGRERIPPPTSAFPFELESDEEEFEGPYRIVDSERELRVYAKEGQVKFLANKVEDVPAVCTLSERTANWKTIDSIMRYPSAVRRLILAVPRLWLKLRP